MSKFDALKQYEVIPNLYFFNPLGITYSTSMLQLEDLPVSGYHTLALADLFLGNYTPTTKLDKQYLYVFVLGLDSVKYRANPNINYINSSIIDTRIVDIYYFHLVYLNNLSTKIYLNNVNNLDVIKCEDQHERITPLLKTFKLKSKYISENYDYKNIILDECKLINTDLFEDYNRLLDNLLTETAPKLYFDSIRVGGYYRLSVHDSLLIQPIK